MSGILSNFNFNYSRMKKLLVLAIVLLSSLLVVGFKIRNATANANSLIDITGKNVETRFKVPAGYTRINEDENCFAAYLRNLPLKPNGTKVRYYNGEIKQEDVYDAVVDMDIGNKDLQQCADAVMRLRGEYQYAQKQYDKISFNFTNGFKADYSEWIKGNRIVVNGNNVSWKKSASPSNTYKNFRAYMDVVFAYAGTLSLSKSLKAKDVKDIAPGDVFVKGGSPGHAVIVIDVAVNKQGKKIFMIAQSYMPAQDIQVLKNYNNDNISPWYSADITDTLHTPQWDFNKGQLKNF